MKKATGILAKIAAVREMPGDCLGVANDRESLEALAEATRRRYEEDPTPEAKERYADVLQALWELQ